MKTLHVRMEQHCYNAQRLAEYLEKHHLIEHVYYPGTNHYKWRIQDLPKSALMKEIWPNGGVRFPNASLGSATDYVLNTHDSGYNQQDYPS